MDRCSSPHDSFRSYDYSPLFPDRPIGPATAQELHALDLTTLCPQDQDYVKRYLDSDTLGQMRNRAAPGAPYLLLKEPRAVFTWSHRHGRMPWFLRVIEHQVMCWERLSASSDKPLEPRPSEWLLDILIWCRNNGTASHAPQALTRELTAVIDAFARSGVRLTGLLRHHEHDDTRLDAIGKSLMSALTRNDGWLIPVFEHCADETELALFVQQLVVSYAVDLWCGALCATALHSGQLDRFSNALARFPYIHIKLPAAWLSDVGTGIGQLFGLGRPFGVLIAIDDKFGPTVQALQCCQHRHGPLTEIELRPLGTGADLNPDDDITLSLLREAVAAYRVLQVVSLHPGHRKDRFLYLAETILQALSDQRAQRAPLQALRITGPLSKDALTALKALLFQGKLMSLFLGRQGDLLVLQQVLHALEQSPRDCMPYSLVYLSSFDDEWEQALKERQREKSANPRHTTNRSQNADADRLQPAGALQATPAQLKLKKLRARIETRSHVEMRHQLLTSYRALLRSGYPLVTQLPAELFLPADAHSLDQLFDDDMEWPAISKQLTVRVQRVNASVNEKGKVHTPAEPVLEDVMSVVHLPDLKGFVDQRVSDKAWMSMQHIDALKLRLKPHFSYASLQLLDRCQAPVDPMVLEQKV